MTNLIIKSHKTQLNGTLLTGDTYPIKSWIKTYLCGKWDAERSGWIVDLGQVKTFTGTCIKIADDQSPDDGKPANSKLSPAIIRYANGEAELGEDY